MARHDTDPFPSPGVPEEDLRVGDSTEVLHVSLPLRASPALTPTPRFDCGPPRDEFDEPTVDTAFDEPTDETSFEFDADETLVDA